MADIARLDSLGDHEHRIIEKKIREAFNQVPTGALNFVTHREVGLREVDRFEENSMDQLSGKIALITGGSSGIGLETAKLFAKEGAFVFITGRRQAELEKAVAAIGSSAKGIRGDIANLGDLDRLFEEIKVVKGRLDILFANAGLGEFAPLGSITEAHFDKTFGVNVRGTLFTVQKALPLMCEGSAIVLNSSIAAIKGTPAFSVYAATKAAIRSFARGWSVDLRDKKIRVNAVSPGTVPTPAYDSFGMTEDQMTSFLKGHSDVAPVGRVGRPIEIAEAVLFLASDKSSFVNGAELFVDGGFAQV